MPTQRVDTTERERTPLQRLVDEFILSLDIERGLSPNTCQAYRTDCERLHDTLPADRCMDPARIQEQDLFDYLVSERKRGRRVVSVRRSLSGLRTFFRFLVRRQVLKEDPSQYLEAPKMGAHLPTVLKVAEVERLIAAIEQHPPRYPLRDKALLELLYATGMRVTEAITLTLDCIRSDLGVVRCFGKGRRERIVPISGKALAAVDEYLLRERPKLARHERTDRLFLSRSGKPLGRETIRATVQKFARLAGVEIAISPHTLRHSLATHLIQAGADLRIVQEILGHVRVETTEIYTHLDRADLKRAHAKFHPRG